MQNSTKSGDQILAALKAAELLPHVAVYEVSTDADRLFLAAYPFAYAIMSNGSSYTVCTLDGAPVFGYTAVSLGEAFAGATAALHADLTRQAARYTLEGRVAELDSLGFLAVILDDARIMIRADRVVFAKPDTECPWLFQVSLGSRSGRMSWGRLRVLLETVSA